jgi:hypothetical protein
VKETLAPAFLAEPRISVTLMKLGNGSIRSTSPKSENLVENFAGIAADYSGSRESLAFTDRHVRA